MRLALGLVTPTSVMAVRSVKCSAGVAAAHGRPGERRSAATVVIAMHWRDMPVELRSAERSSVPVRRRPENQQLRQRLRAEQSVTVRR
jgi:hypothetical protein